MLGIFVGVVNGTINKDHTQFALVLAELNKNSVCFDTISFTNEDGELVVVKVKYDWKPSKCNKYTKDLS